MKTARFLLGLSLVAGLLCACPKNNGCVGNGCVDPTPTATETTFNGRVSAVQP